MEILYLYIEEFRNLKNLEINFSPSFDIVLLEEDETLLINKKANALEGIFGDAVVNVNGIIGINGSGKSNILELVCLLTKAGSHKEIGNFILVVRMSVKAPEVKTNFQRLKFDGVKIKRLDGSKSLPNLSTIYFSNVGDRKEQVFPKEVIDLSQSGKWLFFERENETSNQVKFLLSEYRQQAGIPLPSSILISPRFSIISRTSKLVSIKKAIPLYHELYDCYRKAMRMNQSPVLEFRWAFRFSVLNFLVQEIIKKGTLDPSDEYEGGDLKLLNRLFAQELFRGVEYKKQPKLTAFDIQDIHNRTDKVIQAILLNFYKLLDIYRPDFTVLLEIDNHFDGMAPEVYRKDKSYTTFRFYFGTHQQRIFKAFAYMFDYPDIIDMEWTGISSGHRAFLNLFAQLHSAIRRVSKHENVLICIDEGDLYLHPEWQREFLNKIVTVVPAILKKKLQFLLTTHSPFLVSDLPRENLVLLRPNSDGICEVVDGEESIQRTFGANIIDLFMGPFFLEKGTISEFSLEMIRKAIGIALNKNESSKAEIEWAKAIAEIIGDQMIKSKLKKMLSDDQA